MPNPLPAHLVLYRMLNRRSKSGRMKSSDMLTDFWQVLHLFWNEDRIRRWKKAIFLKSRNSDTQNPDSFERCINLICLGPPACDLWYRGLFALKPLELSRDRKTLTVQFFWQVPGNYELESRTDLLTEPTSSENLHRAGRGLYLNRIESDGSTPPIRSGQTFTFTTKDPKNLPLPTPDLLEMPWFLQRVAGMCGAAEWPKLDYDDHDHDTVDTEASWCIPEHTHGHARNVLQRVREWATLSP